LASRWCLSLAMYLRIFLGFPDQASQNVGQARGDRLWSNRLES
jgi:hypothetical protein